MQRPLDPTRLGDHVDRLYRAAWALSGSREDAEDLVQETFTRLLARPRLLRSRNRAATHESVSHCHAGLAIRHLERSEVV